MSLTKSQRKLLLGAGGAAVACLVFVYTLSYSLPYKRIKASLVDALKQDYDVNIGSIGPTFIPGGMVIDSLLLKTKPKSSDDEPAVIAFTEVKARIGILAAIFGSRKVSFVAQTKGGEVEGVVSMSKDEVQVDISTEDFPLGQMPGLAAAVGLPIDGFLNASLDISLPEKKWSKVEGEFSFECDQCTVGDGKARMKMRAPEGKRLSARAKQTLAFASEGITVPKLELGKAEAKIVFDKGIGTIENFSAESDDGFLKIGGEIKFEDPFKNSTLPGCLTFKLSESLKDRLKDKEGPEKNFAGVEFMLPAPARRDDGAYAIPTKGKLTQLRWNVKRACNAEGTGEEASARALPKPVRPKMTPATKSLKPSELSSGDPSESIRSGASSDNEGIKTRFPNPRADREGTSGALPSEASDGNSPPPKASNPGDREPDAPRSADGSEGEDNRDARRRDRDEDRRDREDDDLDDSRRYPEDDDDFERRRELEEEEEDYEGHQVD